MSKQDDLQQLLEKYQDFSNDFDEIIANNKTDEVLAHVLIRRAGLGLAQAVTHDA